MLTVNEAIERVLEVAKPLPARELPLDESLGLVLAEPVTSDVDSPPFAKSLVDGYAIQLADMTGDTVDLDVTEEVVAGATPRYGLRRGQATRIMTGAPVPAGTDAVVMIERTRLSEGDGSYERVTIEPVRLEPGRNVLPRAAAFARGDVVLPAGKLLGAAAVGLLAEVGRDRVSVFPRPTVSVLSTGDELVPHDQRPLSGQIRNTNSPMLAALARECGAQPIDLGMVRDQHGDLCDAISDGLSSDVLVISGGVSAGVLDLVPGVLAELGVHEVFHKVQVKPGKPIWFGMHESDGQRPHLVFGLPGNPVSSYVCFQLFVRPAVARLAGRSHHWPSRRLPLAAAFQHRGDRPTYHPAQIVSCDGVEQVMPLRWAGSADLKTLATADALAYFPAGDREYAAGEAIDVLPPG